MELPSPLRPLRGAPCVRTRRVSPKSDEPTAPCEHPVFIIGLGGGWEGVTGRFCPSAYRHNPSQTCYTERGNIFAVSQQAADAGKGEAIARLLEWMARDGYYLMGFGEEGVNFIIDDNGNISTEGLDPEQAYTSPERQPFTQMRNQLIFYNSEQEIIARYPTYETINGRLMEPMNFLGFFQEQPWVDGRGIQVILPPANAVHFDRFYNEGMLQFVLGQQELNEETWAEYLAGLDSLGAAEYEAAARQALTDAGLLE